MGGGKRRGRRRGGKGKKIAQKLSTG